MVGYPNRMTYLSTKKKKVAVWLAKIPKYLAQKITQMPRGTVIGSLDVDRPAGDVKILFSDTILNGGLPTQYTIDLKDKSKGMYLISNTDEDRMNVEGVVSKECFVQPVINPEYLEFKRRMRSEEEDKVKVLDYFTEVKKSGKYSALREMDVLARKRKQMLQDRRRERLEKSDVLGIIFNAFEKHSSWTVRDLADFSGQPVAYIQEIVNEICVLNKKDYKNSYELKPEYRQ